MPNVRKLQARGIEFQRHYSNAPVCCPSRATFWSGKHAHNIIHSHYNIEVGGVWNNIEGLPGDYKYRLDQVLGAAGYDAKVAGKTDWNTGGHSQSVYLAAWTMYTAFPYDVNATGGWATENMCGWDAAVRPGGGLNGSGSVHYDDWATVKQTRDWLNARQANNSKSPSFACVSLLLRDSSSGTWA